MTRTAAGTTLTDRAFLLRTVPHGESGAIITVLTEHAGAVALAVRNRQGRGVVIEPFHTLVLEWREGRGEVGSLRTSTIDRARTGLLTAVEALSAAGQMCRWVRALAAPHVAMESLFGDLERGLDLLEGTATPTARDTVPVLTTFGLALLRDAGFGLDTESCARCGRGRPRGRSAWLDPAEGILCETCRAGAPARTDRTLFAGPFLDQLATVRPQVLDDRPTSDDPTGTARDRPARLEVPWNFVVWLDRAIAIHSDQHGQTRRGSDP